MGVGLGLVWCGWEGGLIPQILVVKPVAQMLAVASRLAGIGSKAYMRGSASRRKMFSHNAICHTLFASKSARIIIGSQSPLGGLGGLVGNPEIQATGSWAIV